MKNLKTPLFLFILSLLLLTTLTNLPSVYAQPTYVDVTVSPGKTLYNLNEDIHIYANLTSGGSPIQDGLVGLQVSDTEEWPLIYRTLQTDTPPTAPQLEILNVTPCDMSGNPKNSFEKGTLAWFQIYYNYTSSNPINVTFTLTFYDNETVPLGRPKNLKASLYIPDVYYYRTSKPIPNYASLGTATVYANAYTDSPRLGGVPYCPEVSATFEITGSQTTSPLIKSQSTVTGPYNTTFKLSTKANQKTGNYTAYVSSSYQGQKANSSTTFEVKCLQDVSGPGGPPDGKVNIVDILVLAFPGVYGSQEGDPLYNPNYDIASPGAVGVPDGSINIIDILAIAAPGVYGYDGTDP